MTDAERITRALGGVWYGGYGMAFCPAHENTRTPALKLSEGRDGRLLVYCFTGCDFCDVMREIETRGLVPAWQPPARTGAVSGPGPAPARSAAPVPSGPDQGEDAERAARLAAALRLWRDGVPVSGTLAEDYLRGRAITAPLSASLRYRRDCWHPGAQKPVPGLLAEVRIGGVFCGVHRTWLSCDGGKYDGTPQRAMLGPVLGGAVHLTEGDGPLVVGEGIESVLSLWPRYGDAQPRLWAALSAAGMAGLALPDSPGRLIVGPDGDEVGINAAKALARHARDAGWEAKILAPPGPGLDWNDVAMAAV